MDSGLAASRRPGMTANHPPPRSGGGGPPCEAGWWRGRRPQRAARVFVMPKHVRPLLLQREFSATKTKLRVRRPLHHGSLATRAPVVPLPRFAGAERASVLATRSASEFYPWRGANWESPLRYPPPATCFFLPSAKRGGRTPTDAEPTAASSDAARAQRSAHACRRSTAALA